MIGKCPETDRVLVAQLAGEAPHTRSRAGTKAAKGAKYQLGQTRRARMMARMKERWRRRQQGNGGMPGRTRS